MFSFIVGALAGGATVYFFRTQVEAAVTGLVTWIKGLGKKKTPRRD
jgi:hypothetical protein